MAEVQTKHVDDLMFDPPARITERSHCPSMSKYREMYKRSVEDPSGFWSEIANNTLYWKVPPSKENFLDYNFDVEKGKIKISWMKGGITNVCYNALDKHVINGLGDKIAFYWEGNDPDDFKKITYSELLTEVCKFSNVLKSKGLKKGDRVAIYMPMIIELVVAMLSCARLGLVHSIVFGGYSSNALAERLEDGLCKLIVTADGTWRGDKLLNLKQIADGAMKICADRGHEVKTCVVVRHVSQCGHTDLGDRMTNNCVTNGDASKSHIGKRPCANFPLNWVEERDVWWDEEMKNSPTECQPEWLDAEDPLFILYTSGSTGKPKGVLHTQAGYLLYVATTVKYVFDHHPETDVYWCTADIGWITGHSYVCYGPLANAATSVIFEGTPFYPECDRFWLVIDKYKVTKFYTAPTAIRSLMKFGEDLVSRRSTRDSLEVLGTVGEPINPEAWLWYHRYVGNSRCAIVDTFWQTETGGHVLAPLPGATPTKPGSATFPFFGVVPELISEEGKLITGEGEGYLVFKQPWPGMMRTVYGDHERFEMTYFRKFHGYYTTGDGARRDKDGYLWVTGRIDDMLNVSGHLISTAQVESVLIEHAAVSETAVVAHPHPVKGECLYCFITMKDGQKFTPELTAVLKSMVRQRIGGFAQPDYLQEAPGLPKTRSGKIMRRVLRNIAVGNRNLGDVTTMADESVVDQLFELRPKIVV